MQVLDDRSLLQEFTDTRSDEAFAGLVSRYVNLVYSVAFRQTGNPHHAEEITQAVFIIFAQKAAQLRDDRALSSWLFQATRLTAQNFIRGEIRRQHREQEAFMESAANEPETETWTGIAPLLDPAVASLGGQDQRAILLRFYEGRNLRDVGQALGTTEDAAEKRVSRALDKLRRFFARRGVTSTTAVIAVVMAANSVQAAPAGLAGTVTTVAAARGAAAGASTLTLVKGALKLMAWTKTKIAIVTGVVVLLTAGTATLGVKAINTARTKAALGHMTGNWEGTLTVGPTHLRLVLRIFQTNGAYQAFMDSVDQGATGLPVGSLSARPHFLHAELPSLMAAYEATLSDDGSQLSGTWKQAGKSFPLTMKLTTDVDTVAGPMAASDYAPRADSALQGEWMGTLDVQKIQLRLDLRIAETSPGVFRAQMDSVDQGAHNLPVDTFTFDNPAVHFTMDSLNGSFAGTYDDRAKEITGKWTQMKKSLPITFKRVQTTAQSDMDYGHGASYEVEGHWKGVLKAPKMDLHLVFHIASVPGGAYTATMDSPDQGATAIPATAAKFTYPDLRLEWNQFAGVFTAKLKDQRLTGTWKQGPVTIPLELDREKE